MTTGGTSLAQEQKTISKSSRFDVSSRVIASSVLASILAFGIGGWAAQAKLSGAVIANGQVVVSEQVKIVQHRDGGIVSQIMVENGDEVKKGDILLRLDETQTRVELTIVQTQLQQLQAMHARLIAERDADYAIRFAELGLPAGLVAGEIKLFDENRRMLGNQKGQLRLQIGQLDEQVHGLEAQRRSTASEGEIIEQELAKTERLLKSGLVPISHQRDLLRQRARIEGTRGELAARIAEISSQKSELNMKLLSLDQTTRKEAQAEIVGIESKIAELREREIAARDRLTRMDVRAPVDGLIYDLQIHTLGGIMAPGATVMSVVPNSADLMIEMRIPPVDIDRIATGQSARLRFTAFNQRTTPELHGEVGVVAAATAADKTTGQPYYLATVSLTDGEKLGENKLMPGMPVEVFVQTEERTALSYLVKPFTDQVMRTFREE
ncbi:HlyD family type I secretion periplasmic adaptor subunit [Rhizobium leguminosarum]|uniref:HlyD family type I secretion periplasmic adaptor subunit n=1 Tax=Rhizobium leguminosarum TaxID=384 RepID=UPI001C9042AF|nr:HlyD family type I secretion periplasmic adaptor subunit [Rhizobium leguminosarum]MBY2925584.1 HlyD family type I secretion periplasmic adaptor subunit [Rhizobium leguminosarum]MBY2936172.1 HlyD family type I secretion periplasmic adaptor subunit [Rhizobium leguminosarum]